MAVEYEGTDEVILSFKRVDLTARNLSMKKLIEAGAAIQELAQKFAPRDEANLENAIMMTPDPDASQPRGVNGQFGSWAGTEVTVYVDGDAPVPERPGKTVGDYAYEQETHLEPAGNWQLGEGSRQKQDGQSETVGGAYMERAFDQITEGGFLDDALSVCLTEIVES